MKYNKGFTLIELLIILSIMGILLGYSIPSFTQLKLNNLLNIERNRLTASLQYARTYAVTKQISIIVCPSLTGHACDNQSNWNGGWIVFVDKNRNRLFDVDDLLIQSEDPMHNEIIATSSIHRSKIRYNMVGFSPGTNLSINFCDPRGREFAQSIIVNNAGRVKQSKPISDNVCN
jgi:type IV fimbrial biogenesis protein FimT